MYHFPVSRRRAVRRDSRGSNRPITTTGRSEGPRAPPVFLYFTGYLRMQSDGRVAHALGAGVGSPPSGSARRTPVSKECGTCRSGHDRGCILQSTATRPSSRSETRGGSEARKGYVCEPPRTLRLPVWCRGSRCGAHPAFCALINAIRTALLGTCVQKTGRPPVRAGRRWSAASPTLP